MNSTMVGGALVTALAVQALAYVIVARRKPVPNGTDFYVEVDTLALRMLFGLGFVIVTGLLNAGCGGNGPGGTPSPLNRGIEGTWEGTIAFTRPEPRLVQTTWKFAPLTETAQRGFEAQASWNGITTRALTAVVVGSQFSTNGVYPSPLGCDGIVGADGTADTGTIDATFNGSSSCDSVFEGHMTLTRRR